MRFAYACVNVRMISECITLRKIECHKDNTQNHDDLISKASLNTHANIRDMSVTLETSQFPISLLKASAELSLIQCRVETCEMRFACACVNVRMISECVA
jgi:hypothetical protein